MKSLVLLCALAGTAGAAPLSEVVRDKLEVPAGLGVVEVTAKDDVAPETVAIEPPTEIHVGRQSVRVYVKGRSMWVPVLFGKLAHVAVAQHDLAIGDVIADADVRYEDRAVANYAGEVEAIGSKVVKPIAAGGVVAKGAVVQPPPVARGTTVSVEARRGAVKIHGTGTLELAARVGGSASVRMGTQIVHGTLLASNVVSVP